MYSTAKMPLYMILKKLKLLKKLYQKKTYVSETFRVSNAADGQNGADW